MTSLYAVSQLVDLGEPLPASFDSEVERLADVARRVTLLRGDVEAPPTPFALPDILDRAGTLYAGLKNLTDSRIELAVGEGTPAVLINEARELRLMLLFFDLASHHGQGGRVILEVGGDADGAFVSFVVQDSSMPALEPLDRAAALAGGSVDRVDGRCTLRLPSLSRSRAEGR